MRILKAENAKLYVGDALKVMSRLHAKGVRARLVFADPPFNIKREYGEGVDDDRPWVDYVKWTGDWIECAAKLLTDDGALVVNVPDLIASRVYAFAGRNGLPLRRWIIWHYRFGQNTPHNFVSSHVHCLYFVKNPKNFVWRGHRILEETVRAQMGDKRTKNKKDGSPDGKRCPLDVWYGEGFCRVQGNNKERWKGHDNQLPVAYLRRLILALTDRGDTVFDPFCGSGTTSLVARAYGRRAITSEKVLKSAESAWLRINNHRQLQIANPKWKE